HKAFYARAYILANKPDYKKAETILSDVLKGTPDNVEAIILSGQLDSENKLYKQAVEKFEKAIKLDKNAMQAYLGLGEAYQKMQQFPKAIEVLQKARDLWPDSFMPLVGLGKAYLKNNNYGLALVMFNLAYDMTTAPTIILPAAKSSSKVTRASNTGKPFFLNSTSASKRQNAYTACSPCMKTTSPTAPSSDSVNSMAVSATKLSPEICWSPTGRIKSEPTVL
ncbi:MAG TPA: tetratricopeptide repeat protein, partial [Candidatus Rifleibacterium sp.]|nr:tetratricopeptide repeat protein [Candidatus Rifleibacterium sp.]